MSQVPSDVNFIDSTPVIDAICKALDITTAVNRMVIELQYHQVPLIHTELVGDERLLSVNWNEIGVSITTGQGEDRPQVDGDNLIENSVVNCARCGQDHSSVFFQKMFGRPIDEVWNYWGICPSTGDPILYQIKDVGEPK